jgi:ankyrin repeat protein
MQRHVTTFKFCKTLLAGLLINIGFNALGMDSQESDIFQAAEEGNLPRIQELLAAGIPVNIKDENNLTALMHAIKCGRLEATMELIKAHSQSEARNQKEETVTKREPVTPNPRLMIELVNACAILDQQREGQNTVATLLDIINCSYPEFIDDLIEAGADPNLASPLTGQTPLIATAAFGYQNIVLKLIKACADLESRNNNGFTALMFATGNSKFGVVCELLKAKADPNAQANNGYSSLMLACEYDLPSVCSALIDHGVDIFATDNCNDSAISAAAYRNSLASMAKIISSSFFLNDAPTNNSHDELIQPVARFKTTLLCLQRLVPSRDVRNTLLTFLPDDMAAILIPRIACGAKIPPFALEVMTDYVYQTTRQRLTPMIEEAQERLLHHIKRKQDGELNVQDLNFCAPHFLDMNRFDSHYGKELRANINARLQDKHVRK